MPGDRGGGTAQSLLEVEGQEYLASGGQAGGQGGWQGGGGARAPMGGTGEGVGRTRRRWLLAALGPAGAPPAPGRLIKRRRRLTSVGS